MSFNRLDHMLVQKIADYTNTQDIVNLSKTSLQNNQALSEMLKASKVIKDLFSEIDPENPTVRHHRHRDSRMEAEKYENLLHRRFRKIIAWHDRDEALKNICMLLGNFIQRLVFADELRIFYGANSPDQLFYPSLTSAELYNNYKPVDAETMSADDKAFEYMFNIGKAVLDNPALLSLDILKRKQRPVSDLHLEPSAFLHELIGKEDKVALLIKLGRNLQKGLNPTAPESVEASEYERTETANAKLAMKANFTEMQKACEKYQAHLKQAQGRNVQSSYALMLSTKINHITGLQTILADDRQYLSDERRLQNFTRELQKVEIDLFVRRPSRFGFFWKGVDSIRTCFGKQKSTMGIDGVSTVKTLHQLIAKASSRHTC